MCTWAPAGMGKGRRGASAPTLESCKLFCAMCISNDSKRSVDELFMLFSKHSSASGALHPDPMGSVPGPRWDGSPKRPNLPTPGKSPAGDHACACKQRLRKVLKRGGGKISPLSPFLSGHKHPPPQSDVTFQRPRGLDSMNPHLRRRRERQQPNNSGGYGAIAYQNAFNFLLDLLLFY